MHLLVDRFAAVDTQTTIDLATGDSVDMTITSAGGEADERQWAVRCDASRRLHHPSVAALVDFGVIGDRQRFEARSRRLAQSAPGVPGIVTIDRPAVSALGELFERPDALRPRITALWGPDGSGKDTVVSELARIARLHGFVPVASRLVSQFADVLVGRSLFVIDDEARRDRDRRDGWGVLLSASAGACRAHVLLFVGRDEPPALDGIGLTPVAVDTLIRSVRPTAKSEREVATLRRMAVESAGWPGRFARRLWERSEQVAEPMPPDCHRLAFSFATREAAGRRLAVRAAEPSAVYEVDPPPPVVAAAPQWPSPDELASLQRRLEECERLIAQGRHGPAERLLRQTIGALARRHDWKRAGDGSVILASLLLRRGRVREAQAAIKTATGFCRHAADDRRLVDVAILDGIAAIELARVAEAETRLSAALAAARALGDRHRTASASVALARALFWQGRYDAADRALQTIDESAIDEPLTAAAAGLRSVVSVGTRDFQRAIASALTAVTVAERHADPRDVAVARARSAFVHLAVGDLTAVERDTALSLVAARQAREPLVAARARLIRAEALRRGGKPAVAARVLARITRLRSSTLPPLLRARCDLLADLLSHGRAREVVSRHVRATALEALALFTPVSQLTSLDFPPIMVDDIVGILDLCQTSDDEHAVLTEVCRRIRVRLHAVATAVTVPRSGGHVPLASDGGRLDPKIVQRAAAGGLTIAPHRCEDRLEAAAPIRYGGSTIGVLAARWAIGTQHDLTPAATLLTTTAAVVAPIVSAAIIRAQPPTEARTFDLLGASDGMREVRRGVERAAPAPFTVLIEGESGSGKELVARAIHRSGTRRDRPFCTLNCAALPDDLVEAELFGHTRGAFTGALSERRGVFEEAHGGTLLLDEIGELSPRAQAKVLRVLQEGELRRVGESVSRRVDVRVVSATNRNLRTEAAGGRFRLDLLYRLDVLRIVVPPLRERRDDIPLLAEHFWREATIRLDSRATLAAATLAALARYNWPGNVRELQNVLASLAVRSARRGVVPPTALGLQFADPEPVEASRLDAARRTFEERFVRAALARTGGHRTRTAEELGVTRQGLAKLMSRLGISGG